MPYLTHFTTEKTATLWRFLACFATTATKGDGGVLARHTGGWVKLWRKAALGDIGSNYTRGGLFGALIAMANIQDSRVSWRGKPRTLERGEIVTSMKELAELGEVDRSTVLRHLNYLILRETLTVEKSNKGILVKILNYEQYQGVDADGPHQSHTQAQHQSHFGPNISPTHNEERKNKRTKEIYAFSEFFEELAKEYRETFKGTTTGPAKERFKAQIKTEEDLANLRQSLGNYRKFLDANDWRKPKQTFATYLGTKSTGFFWRDYIAMPSLEAETQGLSLEQITKLLEGA